MTGDLTIQHARLVLPDRCVTGDIVVRNGTIEAIGPRLAETAGEVIDGTGLVCMPGVVDGRVHFREPGLTHKEDLRTGSRAAAAGGVTSFLEMPDTQPATTTREALAAKRALAAEQCVVNYGFFIGATTDNLADLLAAERVCGVAVSTAHDSRGLEALNDEALETVFAGANKLVAVQPVDDARLTERRELYSGSADVADHARIRDVETSTRALSRVLHLAQKHGCRLHVMGVSSEEEVELLKGVDRSRVTADVDLAHLLLDADTAYSELGSFAQVDPPIRSARHRDALWRFLREGGFDLVVSDHAPHSSVEKARAYPESPSGVPGVGCLLPLLLDRVDAGQCTLQEVVRWLCEGPVRTFGIPRKGRLEVGYDGDLVLVDMAHERTIEPETGRSKAGWSPYTGRTAKGWPVVTVVMGRPVFRDGQVVGEGHSRELSYSRNESGQHRPADASVRSWQPG